MHTHTHLSLSPSLYFFGGYIWGRRVGKQKMQTHGWYKTRNSSAWNWLPIATSALEKGASKVQSEPMQWRENGGGKASSCTCTTGCATGCATGVSGGVSKMGSKSLVTWNDNEVRSDWTHIGVLICLILIVCVWTWLNKVQQQMTYIFNWAEQTWGLQKKPWMAECCRISKIMNRI